jgi:chromate reductase
VNPTPRSRAIAFSGSLRVGSTNTALVHLAARVAPDDLEVVIVDWLDQLPYYNPDLETDLPEVARRWRQCISDADALIIALPEYNFGPPALAKNAIDWLTRPSPDHALRGKVVTMLSSAGSTGGAQVQSSLASILGWLGNEVVDEPVVQIARGATRITPEGDIDDAEIVELVAQRMAGVASAIGRMAAVTPD